MRKFPPDMKCQPFELRACENLLPPRAATRDDLTHQVEPVFEALGTRKQLLQARTKIDSCFVGTRLSAGASGDDAKARQSIGVLD
jgi:hypothetical protein